MLHFTCSYKILHRGQTFLLKGVLNGRGHAPCVATVGHRPSLQEMGTVLQHTPSKLEGRMEKLISFIVFPGSPGTHCFFSE
jgi:hypothetical protein